jgi:hypothetical protein
MNQTSVREEIPSTKQGLISYIAYCERQIHENKLHSRRLQTRMGWCQDRLDIINKGESNETK